MSATIVEVDTDTPQFYLDPNSILGAGPDRPQYVRSNYGIEVVSYDLMRDIFREPRLTTRRASYWRESGASPLIMKFVEHGAFNLMETVDHDRIRPVVQSGFRPARITPERSMMAEAAHDLIDQFIDRGSCDFVADFAHFFPVAVIARYIGVDPGDFGEVEVASVALRRLGQRPLAPEIPELEKAFGYFADYARGLVEERRSRPREDFLTEMVAAQAEGHLSEDELIWNVAFLFLAGHDTTRFTLGSCLLLLAESGEWDHVAEEPDVIQHAIAESMRLRPGTPRQMRVVSEQLEFAGLELEKDDLVALSHVGAGRDPQRFPDPDRFDLTRSGYNVGFGHGKHVCVGAPLARADMEEAIKAITTRISNVKIGPDVVVKASGIIGGYDSIPATFDRRPGAPDR